MPSVTKVKKPKTKKEVVEKRMDQAVGREIKPKVSTKTPSYTSQDMRDKQPGFYKDPKTGQRKQFKKQYKA
jgi:hypothetical protein